ncbi:glycosyltransferase family 4 protein [Burkholderia gladioli]|uniref:glycosyltransferase family 4 protein n=1 Tax=Burkholderia gladioli TaxID=28095 RepID=UPI00202FE3DD|nr:glycosyltransferase family 1 protein [Burkholderia gladioli]URV25516.1 glycosyltransferase family 4 protein [Burkholderia gladioli]
MTGWIISHLLQLFVLRGRQTWVKHARWVIASWCRVPSMDRSQPRRKENWLLVDVSIFATHDAGTGIQRVVRSIVIELLRAPPEGLEVKLVRATRKQGYHHVDVTSVPESSQGFQLEISALPLAVRQGDIFLGLDFSSRIVPARMHELLQWKKRGVRFAFVVYDLLPVMYPEWFTRKGRKYYKKWLRATTVYADMFCCISNAVADDLNQWMMSRFGIYTDNRLIRWFHLGASFNSRLAEPIPQLTMLAERGKLAFNRTMLMVGTVEPRKGHEQVLLAFEELWRRGDDVALVVAGRQGWNVEALAARLRHQMTNGARLIWLEDINDQQLIWLYRNLGALLMASKAEGFGLPLVEALDCDMPILARDIPVFREICGDAATYFSGDSSYQLADLIRERLQAPEGQGGTDLSRPLSQDWEASTSWLVWHLKSLQSC